MQTRGVRVNAHLPSFAFTKITHVKWKMKALPVIYEAQVTIALPVRENSKKCFMGPLTKNEFTSQRSTQMTENVRPFHLMVFSFTTQSAPVCMRTSYSVEPCFSSGFVRLAAGNAKDFSPLPALLRHSIAQHTAIAYHCTWQLGLLTTWFRFKTKNVTTRLNGIGKRK